MASLLLLLLVVASLASHACMLPGAATVGLRCGLCDAALHRGLS
jgi:hypothetical protein